MSRDSRDPRLFEKAAFGYKPDEVDRYIDELNRKIASLEAEKADRQAKMKILADKVSEYRAEEGNLKDALLEAQRVKNTIENDARTHAEAMLAEAELRSKELMNEARVHATRLLSEAKSRSEQMIANAKREAEDSVNSVRGQIENEQRILSRMQREVSSFKSTLISIYRSHLNLITSLPEEERKRPAQPRAESSPSGTAAGKQALNQTAPENIPADSVSKNGSAAGTTDRTSADAPDSASGKPAESPKKSTPAEREPAEMKMPLEAKHSDSGKRPEPERDSDADQQSAFVERFGEIKLQRDNGSR